MNTKYDLVDTIIGIQEYIYRLVLSKCKSILISNLLSMGSWQLHYDK